MLRSSILAAIAFGLATSAVAQTPRADSGAKRIRGPVKHAGIYHVATGTWTRVRGSQANVGPDVVYNNSLPSGYFGSTGATEITTGGFTVIDSGNVPTIDSNGSFTVAPDRTKYTINCFEFAYCDYNPTPASVQWQFDFYDSHTPCTDPTVPPVATFTFGGLPAGDCWTIVFDLTGQEFCLEGDGGPVNSGWDGDNPDLDSFGFAMTYQGLGQPGDENAGPVLAGDPDSDEVGYRATNLNGPPTCGPNLMVNCPSAPTPTDGSGTFFNSNLGLCSAAGSSMIAAEDATGRLTQDFWLVTDNDPSTTNPVEGCYFFGGYFNSTGCGTSSNNPYSSAHLVLAADTGECQASITTSTYCQSNPNSTGLTTSLQVTGSGDPADDDVLLRAGNMPNNSFGFFLTARDQALVMNPAGSQGNLCLGTNIGRFVASGQIKSSGTVGEITLDTSIGEWSALAIPTSMGPYTPMSGTTSNFQLWHRDLVGGVAVSNFSDAVEVTWQ